MADQDSQRGSFWTSLPGILTGAAALITAVSGLAIWHNKPSPQPAPAPVVQQSTQVQPSPKVQKTAEPVAVPSSEGNTAAAPGSQAWCAEKYKAWADEKADTGVDDAALRKPLTNHHCNQYGFVLGPIRPRK